MKKFGRAAGSVVLAGALGVGFAAPAEASLRTLNMSYYFIESCRAALQQEIRRINMDPNKTVYSYKMCRSDGKPAAGQRERFRYYITYRY